MVSGKTLHLPRAATRPIVINVEIEIGMRFIVVYHATAKDEVVVKAVSILAVNVADFVNVRVDAPAGHNVVANQNNGSNETVAWPCRHAVAALLRVSCNSVFPNIDVIDRICHLPQSDPKFWKAIGSTSSTRR